ncbi:MAG: acetyl-CoA carboxylase biotin carboxyl carrier protein [Arenicellales bacterium]
MDLRKVKKLIELLEESALIEMEITEGENTIRLSRSNVVATPVVHQAATPVQLAESVTNSDVLPSDSNQDSAHDSAGTLVESPMVGTYYDAPSPDTDSFVKVGSRVRAGDTLCIIEAMKTFNQIEAEIDGTVKAIHKSSGDPVEYGEALFTIA